MMKILMVLILLFIAVALWIIVKKIQVNQTFQKSGLGKKLSKKAAISVIPREPRDSDEVVEVLALDQQLFDDMASIFLASETHEMSKSNANEIQTFLLKKMPIQTKSYVRDLELDEWSIYWGFYQQSLEYYVSRYGVFITHVDRQGNEHKYRYEMKD